MQTSPFTKAERERHLEAEGFCPPDEEPRLNDPPAPGKTCGGCEWLGTDGICRNPGGVEDAFLAADEACGAWEGSE